MQQLLESSGADLSRFVSQIGVTKQLRRGDVLFTAGAQADSAYFVASGGIKLVGRSAEGAETIAGVTLAPGAVGLADGWRGGTHSTDAIAISEATLWSIDVARLGIAAQRSPALSAALIDALSLEVRSLRSLLIERASGDVPARLAGRLLDLAAALSRSGRTDCVFELPFSQQDLASLSDMCRESTNKTLRAFRQARIVEQEGRTIRILRPDVLERLRCCGRQTR